jgi:hypothetical protein
MADVVSIIRDPSKLKDLFGSTPVTIGDIKVDVLVSETPVFEWDIPTRRIDVGVDISDSRYKKPVGVTLDCEFLNPDYSITNLAKGAASAFTGGPGFDNDTWETKRDKLMDLINENELITIITPSTFDYSDMMIDAMQPDFNPQNGEGFFFRVSARHVEQVSSAVLSIDQGLLPDDLKRKPDSQAAQKLDKTKDKGTKNLTDASTKKKSILKKLYDKGLAAVGG